MYFPYIEVPSSAWFTRTLLYWDQVGTIVPESYLYDPEPLTPYMRDLVHAELVRQVPALEARGKWFKQSFTDYLDQLGVVELARRREAFEWGELERIHSTKARGLGVDLRHLGSLGLTDRGKGGGFVLMERRTASEFMAALAVELCQPGQAFQRDVDGRESRWVPTTDVPRAAEALVNGLSLGSPVAPVHLRLEGHYRTESTRLELLERLLPVPTEPVEVDRLVQFKYLHGDLLSQLRRYMEREVDAAAGIGDAAMRQRHLDRIVDEMEDRVEQAERYIREGLQRRVARSPLLRWAKFIPMIGRGADAAREVANTGLMEGDFRVEPLAYLAFASAEFGSRPQPPARIDPGTGYPVGYPRPE